VRIGTEIKAQFEAKINNTVIHARDFVDAEGMRKVNQKLTSSKCKDFALGQVKG